MDIIKTFAAIEDQLHCQRELNQGLRPSRRDHDKEKPKKQKRDDSASGAVMVGFQGKDSATKDDRSPRNKSKAKKSSASEAKEKNWI